MGRSRSLAAIVPPFVNYIFVYPQRYLRSLKDQRNGMSGGRNRPVPPFFRLPARPPAPHFCSSPIIVVLHTGPLPAFLPFANQPSTTVTLPLHNVWGR